MSTWSYITALVLIEGHGSNLPFHDMVRNVLHYAPKIYGSEGEATVKVIDWGLDNETNKTFLGGSYLSSIPCEVCPLVGRCQDAVDRTYCKRELQFRKKKQKMAAEGKEYNGFDDMVAFTRHCMVYINGGLRDTTPEQTRDEFKRFIEYINNSFPTSGKPIKAKVVFRKIN